MGNKMMVVLPVHTMLTWLCSLNSRSQQTCCISFPPVESVLCSQTVGSMKSCWASSVHVLYCHWCCCHKGSWLIDISSTNCTGLATELLDWSSISVACLGWFLWFHSLESTSRCYLWNIATVYTSILPILHNRSMILIWVLFCLSWCQIATT
jgi:hypothetical protein